MTSKPDIFRRDPAAPPRPITVLQQLDQLVLVMTPGVLTPRAVHALFHLPNDNVFLDPSPVLEPPVS